MILLRTNYVSFLLITFVLFYPAPAITVENIDNLVLLEDVVKCKKCHKEHGSEWPLSPHARSFYNKRVLQGFKDFIVFSQRDPSLEVSQELNKKCFSCHAPQTRKASDKLLKEITALIITATDDKNLSEKRSAMTKLSKISIDCGVCHLINGMPEGQVAPNTIYGPGWDEDEEAHTRDHGFATVGSKYLMSSRMCTRCHHDWPAGTQSIVLSYHKNFREHFNMANDSNKKCQKCHMMDGERIIHNMPKYVGTIKFSVYKTVDLIGMGLAVVTFFSMLAHMISRVAFIIEKQENKKDSDICKGTGIKSMLHAEILDLTREVNLNQVKTDSKREENTPGTACKDENFS